MKRRKTIELPTQKEIDALFKTGNVEKLREINERLAKTANQRRAQLYKSGIKNTSALNRMEYYTQQESEVKTSGVFARSKKLSAEQLHEQIGEELVFLRSESSLVTGERRKRAEKSFETLTSGDKPYLPLPEDVVNVPADWQGTKNEFFREQFFTFLDQDAWKDIKKFLYTENTNILAEAGEAISRGAKVKDLQKAYRQYLRNEVDIVTMWDNWKSIK